jgi:hypothetical protein
VPEGTLTPMEPPPDSTPPSLLTDDRPCLTCGYSLRGLTTADVCPECATPVARSLRGDLLRYSSGEYVATLHRGVVLIQASVVGYFLILIGLPIAGIIGAIATGSASLRIAASSPTIMTGLSTLVGLGSILGWWMFSARDPALGERDEGATARVVVRTTIMVQALATVVQRAVGTPFGSPGSGPSAVIDILGALVGLASMISVVVWWFAAMRYIRRLAPRIPSERILRRANLLTWLFPVLLILVCLGWLVDFILYYNLLERIRRDLRSIRVAQATER